MVNVETLEVGGKTLFFLFFKDFIYLFDRESTSKSTSTSRGSGRQTLKRTQNYYKALLARIVTLILPQ